MAERKSCAVPLYKIVLVGDVGVGKTSIFTRYEKNYFSKHRTSSIGVDNCIKEVRLDSTHICKLSVWDTAGLERTGSLTSHYYHKAHCVVLLYAVDDFNSLTSLHHWLDDVDQYASDAQKFIAGNKIDLDDDDWDVDDSKVQGFLENNGLMTRFRVSAKTGEGISEMFESISKHLMQQNVKPSLPNADPFYIADLSTEESLDLRKPRDSSGCSC